MHPLDLTGAASGHRSNMGEIFTLDRNGAGRTSMRGCAGTMTGQELWSLVNYVRSLSPSTTSQ